MGIRQLLLNQQPSDENFFHVNLQLSECEIEWMWSSNCYRCYKPGHELSGGGGGKTLIKALANSSWCPWLANQTSVGWNLLSWSEALVDLWHMMSSNMLSRYAYMQLNSAQHHMVTGTKPPACLQEVFFPLRCKVGPGNKAAIKIIPTSLALLFATDMNCTANQAILRLDTLLETPDAIQGCPEKGLLQFLGKKLSHTPPLPPPPTWWYASWAQ